MQWEDETVTRLRYEHAGDDTFSYYPEWNYKPWEQLAEMGGALLHIKVPDPALFDGIDPERVNTAAHAARVARETFRNYVRTNAFTWCLIKAPTAAWAAKVFPELEPAERMAAMWDAILKMNRVDRDDPILAWDAHIEQLKRLEKLLNEKRYVRLRYAAPGTDLTVELPDGHIWKGGGDHNKDGVYFLPNMPTEEVFTLPKRDGVNGTVRSTMPLNLNGQIIDKFSLTFKDGIVVDYDAEIGKDCLTSLLETDEGSRYLGEVALVPHESPISKLNRIFYNTGIDENASCHFALGSAYPINLAGGAQLSKAELLARGANVSMAHVDFMIGSEQLNIDGTLPDGTTEAVFRQGNWAFELG